MSARTWTASRVRTTRPGRARRRGMTLIELVVGVVITGVMAAIGTAAFGSLIDQRRVIVQATVEVERAVALREMLRHWIGAGAIAPQAQQLRVAGARSGGTPLARQRSAATAEPLLLPAISTGPELRFTTSALAWSGVPNIPVRLFVDGDESTPERGLTIEYQASPQAPLFRRQLDSTITGLRVEYLDRSTGRWVDEQDGLVARRLAARLTLLGDPSAPLPAILGTPLLFVLPGAADALAENVETDDDEFVETVDPANSDRGGEDS